MDAGNSILVVRMEVNEREESRHGDFVTALQEQQQRVIAALEREEPIDAAPIIRDEETLTCEEYVTLVYELHHVHLPELRDARVIEIDRCEETLRQGTNFDEARPLREHSHNR